MLINNPVLRGFSPDPSIVRVGEEYYIATSTFEWFPGVRLHHSRDLVHWRVIGHALTTPEHLDLRGVPDSGGVWAPSLSYADGLFWLIYTNVRTCGMGRPFKDLTIYLTTAPDITGPWSAPVALNSIGFDPALFHDDDGRKWLVNMEWDFRKSGVTKFAGIVLQEYDPRSRRLVGPTTKILQKPVLCEGPNLYKRDRWYYLMLAEGGTGWNHGIAMARSRRITGSYELDPQEALLTTRDSDDWPLQKAGHGELVETPSGEWYLAHLASRPLGKGAGRRCILGRETCLQRVVWAPDGWPRLTPGAAAPAGGSEPSWRPQLEVPAPVGAQATLWSPPPTRDDFDADRLDASWHSLRVPVDDRWLSLRARPGWLRLRGRDSLHSVFCQSLVAKPLRSVRCVAETCVEFEPRHFTQAAGLICYYDTRTHFYLRVGYDEALGPVVGIVQSDDGAYSERADARLSIAGWPQCFLRARFADAALQFSVSRDRKAWENIGPQLDATKLSDDYGSALHFTGAMVGVCVQDVGGTGASADFDYFSLTEENQ